MFFWAGVIAISLVSCENGTKQKENDLAKLNLKGKVMSLEHNLYKVENENDELNEENKESRKSFWVGYHAGWNIAGALLGISTSFDLKFDENGNITKVSNYRRFDITYNLDDDNIRISETWREGGGSGSPYKFKYMYDKGRLMSKKANADDNDFTVKYKYSDEGLLSSITYSEGDNYTEIVNYIKYIDKIHVESLQSTRGNDIYKFVFEYDENYDVSKITRNYMRYDDGSKDIYTFSRYKYDEHDNWIKCVVKEKKADGNVYNYVITRKIRYDD